VDGTRGAPKWSTQNVQGRKHPLDWWDHVLGVASILGCNYVNQVKWFQIDPSVPAELVKFLAVNNGIGTIYRLQEKPNSWKASSVTHAKRPSQQQRQPSRLATSRTRQKEHSTIRTYRYLYSTRTMGDFSRETISCRP
jgi:hypothetical protein